MKVNTRQFKGTQQLRTSFVFGSVFLCDFNLLRDFFLEEFLFFHEHFLGLAQLLDGLPSRGRLVALFPTEHSPQKTHRGGRRGAAGETTIPSCGDAVPRSASDESIVGRYAQEHNLMNQQYEILISLQTIALLQNVRHSCWHAVFAFPLFIERHLFGAANSKWLLHVVPQPSQRPPQTP